MRDILHRCDTRRLCDSRRKLRYKRPNRSAPNAGSSMRIDGLLALMTGMAMFWMRVLRR